MSQNHDTLRRDLDGLQKMAIAIGVIACLGAGYACTRSSSGWPRRWAASRST
jgi:hypothetical protein